MKKLCIVILLIMSLTSLTSCFSKTCRGYNWNYTPCDDTAVEGSNYCSSHKCQEIDCPNERGLCPQHSCDGYTLFGKKCGETKANCYTHYCYIDGCDNDKKIGSQFCIEHQNVALCGYEGCWRERIYTYDKLSSYCTNHTCDEAWCTNKVENGSSYCSSHRKDEGKCNHPECKIYGPFYCLGANNTCPNQTYCKYDLYCDEHD